ncbi:MAG: cell division protein FtsL [Myxococcales bacterium]|nr:cell division protein FtsL [Myxococcales bacterium]
MSPKPKHRLQRFILPRRLGPFGTVLTFFAPVVASAVLLVWARVTAVQLGYELARTQAALQKLEEQNRVIATQVIVLRSPDRLRRIAVRRFGLKAPSAEQVVVPRSVVPSEHRRKATRR